MLIEIRIGSSAQRRWHEQLIHRLRDLPQTEVCIRLVPEDSTKGRQRLEYLMRLERRLHDLDEGMLAAVDLFSSVSAEHPGCQAVDLVLDLTAKPVAGSWSVLYDGKCGEGAAVAALRGNRFPLVSVVDGAGKVRAVGRPGSEFPGLLATSLADVGVGAATLIVGAVSGSPFVEPADANEEAVTPRGFAELAARRLVGAAIRRVYRALCRAPHWRVGWRWLDGPDVLTLGELPLELWVDLPDDGYRFFADPFPVAHQGRTYVFVEDFDHRVGKGVISVAPWGDDGPKGLPIPVLTHDVHLSYPFVLEHAGDMWMIPETSGAETVELYRAVRFPWEWELHSVLLNGVKASDTTVFVHENRWWMTATVSFGGSFSDSLCLWSAPDLLGPWTAHPHNPVLVDIASARPAGRVEERAGRLLRPVQDCRSGYGAALGVAEIRHLDEGGFAQQLLHHHTPGAGWPGTRLHTLNSGGGLETVDGSRLVPRPKLKQSQKKKSSGRDYYIVQREDHLDFLGSEYSALYGRSNASAFQSGLWLKNFYRDLAPARGAKSCIVTVRTRKNGHLVAVLPFIRRWRGPVRCVEYADLGVTDYAAPVLDRDHDRQIRSDPTLPARVRAALGRFDLLLIERVVDDAEAIGGLVRGARSGEHPYGAHLMPLATDVQTWRERFDPGITRRLNKSYKRLRSRGGTNFRLVEDLQEVDAVFGDLRDFRSARFGERGGLDLFQDPDCFAFYNKILKDTLGASGPGKLYVLEVGGQRAAVLLGLAESDRELFMIVGYDFKNLRNLSLGLVVIDQLAQDAIGRGLQYLDLTVGDEPYKAEFGAIRRPLFHVRVTRTPIGYVAFRGRELYLATRRMAKQVLTSWKKYRRQRGMQQVAERKKGLSVPRNDKE